MVKQNIKSKSGFTIIEVVLVLAIAGLIFLMVFVAFPALQRSQRDTRRTDDLGRVQSALMSWQNNHNNRLPTESKCEFNDTEDGITYNATGETYAVAGDSDACEFIRDYMNDANTGDDTFIDPSGTAYSLAITQNISSGNTINTINESATANEGKSSHIEGKNGEINITSESAQDSYVIWVIPGGTCSEDTVIKSTRNDYAILMRMEGSGVKCTGSGH